MEAPNDEAQAVAALMRDVMESALKLDASLRVDLKVGDNWEEMVPVEMASADQG